MRTRPFDPAKYLSPDEIFAQWMSDLAEGPDGHSVVLVSRGDHVDMQRRTFDAMERISDLEASLHATKLERDDFHRELMDLRYQLELAKA